MHKEAIAAPTLPLTTINPWTISGRQDAMLQRRLWQMRMY
jgi:hypothetical protein